MNRKSHCYNIVLFVQVDGKHRKKNAVFERLQIDIQHLCLSELHTLCCRPQTLKARALRVPSSPAVQIGARGTWGAGSTRGKSPGIQVTDLNSRSLSGVRVADQVTASLSLLSPSDKGRMFSCVSPSALNSDIRVLCFGGHTEA